MGIEAQVDSGFGRVTVIDILKTVPSGIGLDISKNHTGVCIWDGNEIRTYGFKLNAYDKSDYHAEYRMRLDFKNRLSEIIKGRHFELCIVEDIFGGDNFDTIRKLAALNTVIDELIFEHSITVGEFVRWNKSQWASLLRSICRVGVGLNSKYETQLTLETLDFDFVLKNKDLTQNEKEEIFYEDICDATGMLLSYAGTKMNNIDTKKKVSAKISDIKVYFFEDEFSLGDCKDEVVSTYPTTEVKVNPRGIEKSLIANANKHPNELMIASMRGDQLGLFGIKRKLKLYEEGVLVFYNKKTIDKEG